MELLLIQERVHDPAMNRLVVWTVTAMIAAAVAVFDLISAWPLHLGGLTLVVTLVLFGIAIAVYGALLVVGVGERRRIIAGAASSAELVGRAASSVRLNALAAIALSILLFANCSASVTSGPTNNAGAMDDVWGFLRGSAEVFLPIVLVILLTAALATAAQVYVTRHDWRSAHKSAQGAMWSVVTVAIVAVVTVPVGFIFLVSQCFFGTSPGACAAGAASFTNVFVVGTFALLLPYVALMLRALASAPSPGPDSGETA